MLGFSPCGNPVVGMYMWFDIVFLLLHASFVLAALPPEPSFAEPIHNVTITAGRDARLQCVVDNLGVHRVAWVKVDTQTLLTLHTHVITHNSRISINHNGHRNWDLHIKQIQEADRGLYMCQVNSSPMKSQVANIEVFVPPDIISDETSSDLWVPEGSTTTLQCRAKGYPPPKLSWRREDNEPMLIDNEKVFTTEGETLTLLKITRSNMGAYLCIASNGIPPSVSKRINLNVEFVPSIKVSSQMVGAPAGGEVIMDCCVEASPRSVNYWLKETGEVLFSNEKYDVQQLDIAYKMHMKLKIRYLERKDFGKYKCVAKNSKGAAEGDILLHELQIATVRTKADSDDSRISFRIEEHIGGNDSASHYKTLSSQRINSDKEAQSPEGGSADDGRHDVYYPSVKYPAGNDDASAQNCAAEYLKLGLSVWFLVMATATLCFAMTFGRTVTLLV